MKFLNPEEQILVVFNFAVLEPLNVNILMCQSLAYADKIAIYSREQLQQRSGPFMKVGYLLKKDYFYSVGKMFSCTAVPYRDAVVH